MGLSSSRSAPSAAGRNPNGRHVDRSAYYGAHPGLHNQPRGGIASVVTRRIRSLPDAKDEEIIKVKSVDLDIRSNTLAHHTNEFDITDALVYDSRELLVIRRGQQFNIRVEFNRQYDKTKDDLRFVFQFGKRPTPSNGTHEEFILSDRDVPNEWSAFIKSKDQNSLSLVVMTPATCHVGKWSLKIDIVKRTDTSTNVYRYTHDPPIYILFNPWCKDDLVYMHEEKLLEEYILNETGKIYSGNYKKISPKPWVFGQFSENVLDCVIHLLDSSDLPDRSRGDPVQVSRKISGMVNEADDNGVLVGNWSGKYEVGTSPLAWTGSAAILEKYYKTKQPVKYGQCWVFSGVVTTVCRALGIPARSVTNFSSAHDTEGSITVDIHFDSKGEPIDEFNADSVWNFHVWNDVWMARPDLPSGFGGWQAIDATPQETSEGIYCMGPTSLRAIKNGDINLSYDGHFIFAEVNADKVYWKMDEEGMMNIIHIMKYGVGRCMSTKRAYGRATWRDFRNGMDPDKEDITDQYKFEEDTDEERTAVRRANLRSTMPGIYSSTGQEDVVFELSTNNETFMGDTASICLKLHNTSDSERTISGAIAVSSMYYTGVIHKHVTTESIDNNILAANEERCIDVQLPADNYLPKLMDHCMFNISVMCMVDESKQIYVDNVDLRLRKPHLDITAPSTGTVGKKVQVEVSFVNPLSETLTKCELRVDGPGGLQRPVTYKQANVNSKQTFIGTFAIKPVKPGSREIVVCFNCDQIYSVNASHTIVIDK